MHILCPLDSLACSLLYGDCWLLALLLFNDTDDVVSPYHIQQPTARNRDQQQTYRLNKLLKAQADFSAAQANLRSRHQLPADAVIICVKKGVHTEMDLYSHGCLAFVDDVTGKLICSARFIPLLSLDSVTFQEYNHLVSTVYRHGLARNIVRRNKAANMIPPEERSGQMFAIGSRSPLFTSDENAGALVWPFGAF